MAFDLINTTPNALVVDDITYEPGHHVRLSSIGKNTNAAIAQGLLICHPVALTEEYGASYLRDENGRDVLLTSQGISQAGGATAAQAGTVTSVNVSTTAPLVASGGPVTSAGTIALSLANTTLAAQFLAGPTGAGGVPSYRAIAKTDLPALSVTDISGAAPTAAPTFTGIVTISGTAVFGTGYTFATLPAAAGGIRGMRTFISDGPASPTFGGAAAGGGSKLVPVYCDGTGWFFG